MRAQLLQVAATRGEPPAPSDFDLALDAMVRVFALGMRAERVCYFEADPEQERLICRVALGNGVSRGDAIPMPPLEDGAPAIALHPSPSGQDQSPSCLDVFIWQGGRLAGLVRCEDRTPSAFDEHACTFAGAIGRGLSLVLEALHLRQVEERYRTIARASSDVLWDWDLTSHRLSWSEGLHALLRLDSAKVGVTPDWWTAVVHPEDRDRFTSDARGVILGMGDFWRGEYRVNRGDGSVAHTVVRGQVCRNAAGTPQRISGTIVDVTERKELEARQVLAERLASVGQLAAGIAHEMKNFISVVENNLEFVLEQLDGSSAVSGEILDSILDARNGAERGRRVMKDLQMFSRDSQDELGAIDVQSVIESALSLARCDLRRRARLIKDYLPIPAVYGNSARLGQVILNLVLNAAQAIPEGASSEHIIRVATLTGSDGQAVIEVSDAGSGVPEHLRQRIFEPFFTTKPVGIGTGLGLSISRSIIESMGGRITVWSREQRGTVMRIALPPALPESEAA